MKKIALCLLFACFGCSMAFAADGDKASRDPSKITFDFKNTPLTEVVQVLADKSGNKPFLLGEAAKEKAVTLSVKDCPYWEAVDKLAEPAGLLYAPKWMTADGELLLHGMMGAPSEGRLALLEAEKDGKLTGYAGPAVVKVDSVGKLVFLRTAKQPTFGMPGTEGLSLGLVYFWEDRLDPLTEEVELTKIRTSKGEDLLPPAPEARRKTRMAMMGPGPKWAPTAMALFNLALPAPDARSIAELAGIVRLEYATGEREVMIDDVFAKVGQSIKVDDWTITVKKVTSNQGALVIDIEVKFKGEPFDLPRYWTAGSYGWYVQKGEGEKRTRGVSYGGGGGGVGRGGPMMGGPALQPTQRPGTGPQQNPPPAGGRQGNSNVMFVGEYEAGASNVILVLPKFHEIKEYPFVIKDIPLP